MTLGKEETHKDETATLGKEETHKEETMTYKKKWWRQSASKDPGTEEMQMTSYGLVTGMPRVPSSGKIRRSRMSISGTWTRGC